MNQNKIITISRQYGSGGRIVGKKLAEALGIPFYDNELITMAAEKTGLSVECFKDAEKTSVGNLFFSLTSLTPSIDSVGLPLNEKIFLVQSQVIKEVAEEGPCVIVGRSANYVLSENPNCINIFLHADIRGINDVQQQRRLTRLLQRRFKRRHQIVRQMTNKAYGVSQYRFADVGDVNTAQRWVQGGEQLVRGIDFRFGYLVEQR